MTQQNEEQGFERVDTAEKQAEDRPNREHVDKSGDEPQGGVQEPHGDPTGGQYHTTKDSGNSE